MGRARRQYTGQEMVIQDLWEWANDERGPAQYTYQFGMVPTRRRGVWKVVCRAHDCVDGAVGSVVAKVSVEWPNATQMTLESCLLQLAGQLSSELDLDPLQRSERERVVNG